MKSADRFWHDFFLNLVAWFVLLFLIVTAYQNHILKAQLNVVCDAIEMPQGFQPSFAIEKAHGLCEEHLPDTGLMPID
jgi:hypothetical protein